MRKNSGTKYIALLFIQLLLLYFTVSSDLNNKQSIAIHIIALFISSTFLFWNRRVSFAFLGVALLLFLNVLDINHLLDFVSLDIILFLISMMIIVSFLERAHLFDHVILRLLGKFKDHPYALIVILMLAAALSAALVDEVTSILIIMTILFKMTDKLKVHSTPFLLMLVFATNIGSSATVVGNPVGVIIALRGELTFTDFLVHATPISAIALFACIILCLLFFHKDIRDFGSKVRKLNISDLTTEKEVKLHVPIILLFLVILGLVSHSTLETILRLEKNTLLLGTTLAGAGIALLLSRERARELVERGVDWWTLTFFMFLFSSVGSLEYTGVVDKLGQWVLQFSGNDFGHALPVVFFGSGILSAMLDNVLAVAILAPVVENISTSLPVGNSLWWGLLFGSTLFGNLTHIGSTANIVALGLLQKHERETISLKEWILPGAIISICTAIIAIFLLLFLH